MDRGDHARALRELCDSDVACADSGRCAELLGHTARLRSWLDATEADITTRLAELHEQDGAAPAADVVAEVGNVSAREARRRERRAAVIGQAPTFGDALADGEISAEHVDAFADATAKLDDQVRRELFWLADDLLADATRLTPERFARSVRDLARRLERDNGLGSNERQRRDTYLTRRLNPRTGMVEGRYALHPELANQIFGAIDREVAAIITEGQAAGEREHLDRSVDRNRLAAEAWGRLVAGGHHARRPLDADITIICDHHTATTGQLHDHTVCETSDGATLPPASIQRLLCTGRVTPVIIDTNGVVLAAGRTIRHANRHQRRALRAMYRTCAFADCDIAFDRCEIHHLLPWELGGTTDLVNLLPVCSRHHHVVHEHRWTLELAPDRTLTIRQPDGTVFTTSRPDMIPDRQRRQTRRRTAA